MRPDAEANDTDPITPETSYPETQDPTSNRKILGQGSSKTIEPNSTLMGSISLGRDDVKQFLVESVRRHRPAART